MESAFWRSLASFVAVTRIFNLVVAGVQPEAWALGAMMTAPFTIGAVSLGDCWDGLGRDRCTTEAKGSWRLSSRPAFSVRSSLPLDEYAAALVHPEYSWSRYGTDGWSSPSGQWYQRVMSWSGEISMRGRFGVPRRCQTT